MEGLNSFEGEAADFLVENEPRTKRLMSRFARYTLLGLALLTSTGLAKTSTSRFESNESHDAIENMDQSLKVQRNMLKVLSEIAGKLGEDDEEDTLSQKQHSPLQGRGLTLTAEQIQSMRNNPEAAPYIYKIEELFPTTNELIINSIHASTK